MPQQTGPTMEGLVWNGRRVVHTDQQHGIVVESMMKNVLVRWDNGSTGWCYKADLTEEKANEPT